MLSRVITQIQNMAKGNYKVMAVIENKNNRSEKNIESAGVTVIRRPRHSSSG
jgi:predicted acetyltransferase